VGSILDRVNMAQRVAQPLADEPRRPSPSAEQLVSAVRDFLLRTVPGALGASVTKLAVIDAERTWEAEADVQVPNATIKALGLPTRRPVVDTETYLLRLNEQLQVIAYGLKNSVET
jgi:hypothetical protein